MHIAIDSYGAVSRLGLWRGLAAIRKAGFLAVDMSYYYEAEELLLGERYLEAAERLADYLSSLSLTCRQAHAPFTVTYAQDIVASPAFLQVKRAIESAAILGARHIVVHTVRVPQEAVIDPIGYNLAYYRALLPTAERAGIAIAVENLFYRTPDTRRPIPALLSRPERLTAFVRALGSPYAVPCVDIGHAAITGCPPEEFLLGMRDMPPRALHVQDCEPTEDSHTLPFLGTVNWEAVTAALRDIGYAGDLTLEVYKYIRAHGEDELPAALERAAATAERIRAMLLDPAKA